MTRLEPFPVPRHPELSANGSNLAASAGKPSWPELAPAALHGLAGEVVQTLDPETEADPVGVLLSFLAGAGALIGPRPHAFAEVEHPGRLNVVLVGETAKGRKGSSWANVRRILEVADPEFVRGRIQGGFGSGEALADSLTGDDKRLLVLEAEFARLLNVASRDGSTLSVVIRGAWDSGRLEVRSRAGKVIVDGAHIGVLAHITLAELRARLTSTEVASGFANRFLFGCVRRSKLLPRGGNLDAEAVAWLGAKLADQLTAAGSIGRMVRAHEAEELWSSLYQAMANDEPPGLVGAVVARDAPQVLRLSVLYALLDGSRVIERPHLEAGWAIWQYCRASADLLFGDATGDPIADRLLALLVECPNGMVQRQVIGRAFAHYPSSRVDRAIDVLEGRGLVVRMTLPGPGRPSVNVVLREVR